MRFIRASDLKAGMRLARPIYNKTGVLLYEQNSLLTSQGIESINNFGLIGIYVLEPAEPAPPLTSFDLEFERFQAMCVFAIAEEMKRVTTTSKQQRTHLIVADIIRNYGHLETKINFSQNLRSNEDYIYKHAMYVALLAAMLGNKLNLSLTERNDVVIAALLHDMGKLSLSPDLVLKDELSDTDRTQIRNVMAAAYAILDDAFPANPGVKRICSQYLRLKDAADQGKAYKGEEKIIMGSRILLLADFYDNMTAMRYGKPPASEVEAIKYLLKNQDIFQQTVIDALIDSINILYSGVSVVLNNGDTALVLAENSKDILRPQILNFRNNFIIDLADLVTYKNIEIVDIMKTMDNRHVLDINAARGQDIVKPES